MGKNKGLMKLYFEGAELNQYIKNHHLLTAEQVKEMTAKSFPIIDNAIITGKYLSEGEGKVYWSLELLAYTQGYKGNKDTLKKEYENKKLDYSNVKVLEVTCNASTGEVMVYANTGLPYYKEMLARILNLELYYFIISKDQAVPAHMYLDPKTNFEVETVNNYIQYLL